MGHSIKNKLVLSFFAVMIPIVLLLVANNWYAKHVVREKVSETYRNTLDIFVRQTDRSLLEINDYLYKMATLDSDVGLLTSFPYASNNYVLTKVRIQNKINRDIGFYNLIDTIFFFNESDIILSTSGNYGVSQQVLRYRIEEIAMLEQNPIRRNDWFLMKDELLLGENFLVKTTQVTEGFYVGAIIKISDIRNMFAMQWEDGDVGESEIYRNNGERLIEPLSRTSHRFRLENFDLGDKPYRTIANQTDGESYMVMNRSSEFADLTYSIGIPESNMLKGLPYFQKATYFMAFGFLLIFALYLLFIRHTVFIPLQRFISGMKKISLGMLDVRLQTSETTELVALANAFNTMAEQIKTLKIGMYEEQLRAQKIELKQLQAQINPHFYMNSLNIIYNFAVLKDYESVKKMALHLADYFRFLMKTNRDLITLEEEIEHIGNYIEIQKLRFPNKLECIVNLPPSGNSAMVPALSIQPFVENAIIHGFVNRRQTFRVKIFGELCVNGEKRAIKLTVEDNGVGFPPDILAKLNSNEPLPKSQSNRLGIHNVIQRLKLRYGSDSEVRFANSGENGGAAIHIMLPLQS
jgi:two-component system, sensor histidine kinase YesM